jgi:hypothetical protein
MPYIITTRAYATSSACPRLPAPRTRRAVATLGEVQRQVEGYLIRHGAEYDKYISRIPESGGPIGPLPDGTVIEVEQVKDIWELFDALPIGHELHQREEFPSDAEIIDAYNARGEVSRMSA